jgi:hypothetical protein
MILSLDEDVGWFLSASAKAAVGAPLFSNPAYTRPQYVAKKWHFLEFFKL